MPIRECILVTGGAGFIGSALSHELAGSDLPVVAIDNLLPQVHPSGDRPENLDPRVELIVADVSSPETWQTFLTRYKPAIIVHLAAETGTAQSLTESTRHAMVNVVGTTMMLDAFVKAGVIPNAIVLTSSRAVYGEGMWIDENSHSFYPHPRSNAQLRQSLWNPISPTGGKVTPVPHKAGLVMPNPTSVYGATKLAQENVLSSWCSAFDVPLTVLRLQNVYGVGQSPFNPYTGIINIFHRVARNGDRIEVYEDGEIDRDFVYISDVIAAITAAFNVAEGTRVIDVGTGRKTTIYEAAQIIAKLHGAPAPVICGKFRDGDVRSAFADTRDLESILQVKPLVSFEEGAKRVGDWLVEKQFI
jgi:dTDP-L-rhamnose 4-epimerase